MHSRRPLTMIIILMLALTGCKNTAINPGDATTGRPTGSSPTATKGYPSSMAALGDSITLAFGSCLMLADCPRNSWATGDGTRVSSHYKRISAANRAMRGNAHNFAVSKATVADLDAQATAAVTARVEYVAILIGANDACHGNIDQMTSVATFRSQLDAALTRLARDLPKARILLASIPNIYHLWEIGHDRRGIPKIWSIGICPALLTNPTSTAAADVARRAAFRDRIVAYNSQIVAACAAHRSQCRDDGGAAYRTTFTLSMINTEDFFHPNSAGQSALAKATYPSRFTW